MARTASAPEACIMWSDFSRIVGEIQSTYSNMTRAFIDIRIEDLAILIDNNGPAAIALAFRPGMTFGERIGVRKKELYMLFVNVDSINED
jgi:hypothetical protein